MGVSLTNADKSNDAFSQSVGFRVHEGVNMVSDFLLKVGSDSVRLAALVKEFPSTSYTMYGPSRLNKNLPCQEKVGEICSFCCKWTGPHRCSMLCSSTMRCQEQPLWN